ncbi:UDP-N-acetylmuramoyl-tripeptide--D-alanyl-D-alanine ligase [Nesterenkonia sp. NBAIMH1]|uniref:UDP-N-acetylmuramoyl-tripeptide--D-alanyl-D- alanine ligase n=1 Tax=Nesterenkonia sp. NBAIMH1 TaxID=2600320 RepID=UPI0011B5ADCB|nr:UDP-N-acetylmuramoyl-tripeptide--D-alanyl-D-alanine ligase [Nesterenkonia sp. NBAIMH1]
MIALTAEEIASAVGGRLRGAANPEKLTVTHADTDSRGMRADALFVAKPGERTDGHLFIDAALEAGAVLVLAERETDSPNGTPHPAVIVEDVIRAMGALAAEIVRRIRAHSETTVIGITGSSGKTTTKDLLRALLEPEGPTVAPQGSYNGEVGVPLTIFMAELETRHLIVEMGADAPGNIADLCEIVRPDIGVVLMVGSAHAGKFGGADKIALTKGELAAGATGHVLLNADDSQVTAMAERASAPVTWFGEAASSEIQAQDVTTDSAGHPVLTLAHRDADSASSEGYRITSGLTGTHHVTNILAAAAAAYRAGADLQTIAARLDGLGPSSRWRMERIERADGVTIINDAYNANPESMREALKTLARLAHPEAGEDRRSVAVLGAMLELGDEHNIAHIRTGETVVRLNIDRTLVVGDDAYPLYRGAVAEGSWDDEVQWVPTSEEAEAWLQENLRPGDVVLFKSSNGVGLRLLGDRVAGREDSQ